MKKENQNDASVKTEKSLYDNGNILPEDIPQDIIPDEVPGKDGLGGE